ncbi:MAG: TonB-dependent receptor [Cyclobacteriaceae bacterium]|nr:TonB-dependent receptor [Cyclobacteriaceae bacterium]
MKILTMCLGVLLALGTARAQEELEVTGRVVDASGGGPLAGAQIVTTEGTGTVADRNGAFHIRVSSSTPEVTISFLGYLTQTLKVSPGQTDLGTIALSVSPTSLSEIIVSATSQNYRSDFKGSNFTISPRDIQNTNPLNTEEVLKTVPGVNIVGDMGLSNRPNISIRGSWGRRSRKILLLEDGSPAAPAPYIAPGTYYNPLSDRVQAIEVYKGADMLRYGPNNMYGAVNYITALPPQQPELRVKLVGGSRNYTTGLFSYGGSWQNLGALVEAVHKKFDGFTDNAEVEVLNLNAKIFAKLSENQSLYFKVSAQFEDNQATLSALTPFTFRIDPKQQPFDAEYFDMRRYGMDIIHKWLISPNLSLTSKIYASDFERDWWRQVTTVVRAADVQAYVGDKIFNDRYSYLSGLSFGDEDFVRVGRITDGRESTTDSQWVFTVSGIQETFEADWQAGGETHHFEGAVKLHQESYRDRYLAANNSRWARAGNPTSDNRYHLWSVSGYLRNEFNINRFNVTPIVRFEHIEMFRQNVLAAAQDPDATSPDAGKVRSTYNVVMPGLTLGYEIPAGEVYGSIYQGFIAPSKIFGFFVERNGVLTDPLEGENVNIKPELSLNLELGWQGSVLDGRLSGQAALFSTTVRNFIAAGENELFTQPGKVRIRGAEAGFGAMLTSSASPHGLRLTLNATMLTSEVLEGVLQDKDMFSTVVHNSATRQEFVNRVNSNRQAYELYTRNDQGQEVLLDATTITEADFANISKALVRYGDGYVEGARAPYVPNVNITAGLSYSFRKFAAGVSGTYVSDQYAEFMNFDAESGDGAIGKLESFYTIDCFANYDFLIGGTTTLNVFVNGKNITNEIYKASRLNRAASGVFPGGFGQLILGVNLKI